MVANGQAGLGKLEQLVLDIRGDRLVAHILDVASVDVEDGQALLVVGGRDRGQIDRAGSFGAVEAPDGLGQMRVHVHGLGAVAPAGRHGQRDADAFAAELLGAGRGLGHAADAACRR